MTTSMHQAHRSSKAFGVLLGMLALLTIGTTALHAQRFQYTYGGSDPVGEEANAVIEARGGDYVTAGISTSNGNPLVYVLRTDPNGIPIWQYIYKINGIAGSGATDIKEYPNGDFIVVGWTEWSLGGSRQLLAMRIDANGIPVWTRAGHIGQASTMATSVTVAEFGDGSTTRPGDAIFSGYTAPISFGTYDGLLGRIDGNGTMLWTRTYDLTNGPSDEMLYGVDESRAPAGGGLGDIIATGVSYPADVWVLRVDGNNGRISSGVHGSALIGGPLDDIGYSIQELRQGGNPGYLAITGKSYSRPFPSTGAEAFVLEMTGSPCAPSTIVAARYLGDNDVLDEWGACIREITSPSVGNVGNLMIGGSTYFGGYGGLNGFMQEFQEGSLAPVWQNYYYGSTGDDELRSIAEAPNAPTTPGYVFAGVTDSPRMLSPGALRNFWLAKNNTLLENACGYEIRVPSDAVAPWTVTCIDPVGQDDVVVNFYATDAIDPAFKYNEVCYDPFKAILPENEPVPAPGTSPVAVTLAGSPEPVLRGDELTLRYSLSAPGTATITIADALGHVRHQRKIEGGAGAAATSVSTKGWTPGVYVAKITINGSSATTKITLLGH